MCDVLWYHIEDIKFADTPTELQYSIGSSALLECVVTGQPKPTVSWRFNRRKLTPGNITHTRTHIPTACQFRPRIAGDTSGVGVNLLYL